MDADDDFIDYDATGVAAANGFTIAIILDCLT